MEHLSCLRFVPGIIFKHQTKPERLPEDKHSSLRRTLINYGRKKFLALGPAILSTNIIDIMLLLGLGYISLMKWHLTKRQLTKWQVD